MGRERNSTAMVVGKKAFSRKNGTRLNLRLDTTLVNSAKTLAKRQGTTVSAVLVRMLRDYVATQQAEQF